MPVAARRPHISEVDMAVIAVAPLPEAASVVERDAVPDGARLVSCPLCGTTDLSLTHEALEAGGSWRCARCRQNWHAGRLARVAAYAAWIDGQGTKARMRGTSRIEDGTPLSVAAAHVISDAAGRPAPPTRSATMTKPVGVAALIGLESDAAEDEEAAARCAGTTVLITAAVAPDVEAVARRIHAASVRARFPFVYTSAAALPTDAAMFSGACARLLSAASGGSLLLTNVEDMPALVQELLLERLAGLQAARDPLAAVRVIAGTTANLQDRIADGMFSERLFYRLNIIHVVMPGCLGT